MKLVERLGDMDRLVEFGRTIGITRRFPVKKITSPSNLIAGSNLRGVLRSKLAIVKITRCTSGVVT